WVVESAPPLSRDPGERLPRNQPRSASSHRSPTWSATRLSSSLALPARPTTAESSRGPGWRLPSLTGLLVRGLVLLFGLTVVWKLALLGFETYELSRFTRPPIVAQSAALNSPAATDLGLGTILREAGLPG